MWSLEGKKTFQGRFLCLIHGKFTSDILDNGYMCGKDAGEIFF